MAHTIYRCPNTGYLVQAWLENEAASDKETDAYRTVTCTSCGQVHLLNTKTGKLIGTQ